MYVNIVSSSEALSKQQIEPRVEATMGPTTCGQNVASVEKMIHRETNTHRVVDGPADVK